MKTDAPTTWQPRTRSLYTASTTFPRRTIGLTNLQSVDLDREYTDQFSGTSSVSPIVVGALACGQGAWKGEGQCVKPRGRDQLVALYRDTADRRSGPSALPTHRQPAEHDLYEDTAFGKQPLLPLGERVLVKLRARGDFVRAPNN